MKFALHSEQVTFLSKEGRGKFGNGRSGKGMFVGSPGSGKGGNLLELNLDLRNPLVLVKEDYPLLQCQNRFFL